jgi:hypothetical protein
MGRRKRRPNIPVTLTLPADAPSQAEIDAILMATDAIIGQAGRNGVGLILKGSRSQKAFDWAWDQLPEYGLLGQLTTKEIGAKVDWCIHHGWLRLEHERGIPLLFHSTKGWERVKELWVERLLNWFAAWQAAGQPQQVWPRLETINREIKFMLLEAIEIRQRRDLIPVLRAWSRKEVHKVRQAIDHTLQHLAEQPQP